MTDRPACPFIWLLIKNTFFMQPSCVLNGTLCQFFRETKFDVIIIEIYIFVIFRADIAVIGLAVMGQNLILNMNDHGYVVCAYNRTPDKVTKFLSNEAKNTNVS